MHERYITHEGSKWVVHAEDGSVLGEHETEEEAKAQLAAIEASKHKGEKALPLLGIETRSLPMQHAQLRVRREGKAPRIVGYAAVHDKLSENLGGFREQIARGAFDRALERADCRALINHDANLLMGRMSAGTLRLSTDETGLKMEIEPPDTELARHYLAAIERGDMTGASFSFTIDDGDDDWTEDEQGRIRVVRFIRDLFDVGPVTFPAYLDTTVASRSLASHPTRAQRLSRQRLRMLGVSHSWLRG